MSNKMFILEITKSTYSDNDFMLYLNLYEIDQQGNKKSIDSFYDGIDWNTGRNLDGISEINGIQSGLHISGVPFSFEIKYMSEGLNNILDIHKVGRHSILQINRK